MPDRPYSWTGEETHLYDDIIHLPHPVSRRHPPMSLLSRAAQFSPYAALVGYDDSVKEVARFTDEQSGLFDDERGELNQTLFELAEACEKALAAQKSAHPLPFPTVTIAYFQPDEKKSGGANGTHREELKRVDMVENTLLFKSGKTIPLQYVNDAIWEKID